MNVTPIFDLGRATIERRIALLPPPKDRIRFTPGGVKFAKSTGPRRLSISYVWGGGAYRSTVDVIAYGGRYAIFRCSKFDRMVTGRELLSALAEYRRSAADALEDRIMREASWFS